MIKIENLKLGMIIKNYKELCKILDVDVKTGGARQNQIAWFEDYFSYKKEGHKFIITGIFDKDIEPMQGRGGANNTVEYIENIELLILDILSQKKDGTIFLSKNKLFRMLEMVNDNYLDCNRRVPKLSKFLDIDENSVQEWYDTTGGMLERNVNSALKRLSSQSLIFWSREITICQLVDVDGSGYLEKSTHKDRYGNISEQWVSKKFTRRVIREATDDEKKYIIKQERNIIEQLECNDKQEVIRKGLWGEFEKLVGDIIRDEYRIIYYYQSYKILFNPEHVVKRQHQLNDNLLNHKTTLNESIMVRVEGNAKSRKENAIKNMGEIKSPRDLTLHRRASDEYVKDNIKLNETLIDRNSKDIRRDVRIVKLE